MTLLQLWRQYTSQELLGETLREAAPELFDELNTAIEQADARESFVQEVIRLSNKYELGKLANVRALHDAARKLAERKP